MGFHVACPITWYRTCHRGICFCSLGFPRSLHTVAANDGFLDDIVWLQEFLKNSSDSSPTVQVAVPKVLQPLPPPPGHLHSSVVGDAVDEAASMQAKRVARQRKGAAAMIAAEEYARRFESGDVPDKSGNIIGEECSESDVRVFCRMCNRVENEGSDREKKMLSCKSCGKKYHRNCLRIWAQHRDLFHWTSWTCPACRTCEACKRTGDPSKFVFCKRCDGAYHCYCLQPPQKNISAGPYVCTRHARCHSCESNVPGNGSSVRWFMGYACCDACGRLFMNGNYCPVCLKVYRDSELTPMVCCDICQRWVHCHCDNISDEKYHQFQVDGNLQYKCPACRGECSEVKNLKDAIQELWRRKDMADRDLIASLRAEAGLPTQEESFSISPYSDDDNGEPVKVKSESGRPLKSSLKTLCDNLPKKIKDNGKKHSSKRYAKEKDHQSSMPGKNNPGQIFEGLHSCDDDIKSQRNEAANVNYSPAAGCPVDQSGILKHKFMEEVSFSDEERKTLAVPIRSNNKAHGVDREDETGENDKKTHNVKGKKLIINLTAQQTDMSSSPQSDALSFQKDQGNRVDTGQSKVLKVFRRERNVKGNISRKSEAVPLEQPRILLEKRSSEGIADQVGNVAAMSGGERKPSSEGRFGSYDESDDNNYQTPSHSLPEDSKPLLRIKFKKPGIENRKFSHWEGMSVIKGQRSKRKRPSPLMDKAPLNAYEDVTHSDHNARIDEIMDANWILMKLGKDAIGKRVEVHQTSDNPWHKGVVSDIIEGTSKLSVALDDGKAKMVDLNKQGVRFVPQKNKRSKA